MAPSPVLRLRVDEPLLRALQARGGGTSPALVMRAWADRYLIVVAYGTQEVRALGLTPDEADIIIGAAGGTTTLSGWGMWQALWAEVADYLRLGGQEDTTDLARRLRDLTAAGRLALADMVDRAWTLISTDSEWRGIEDLAREVGMIAPGTTNTSTDTDESEEG